MDKVRRLLVRRDPQDQMGFRPVFQANSAGHAGQPRNFKRHRPAPPYR